MKLPRGVLETRAGRVLGPVLKQLCEAREEVKFHGPGGNCLNDKKEMDFSSVLKVVSSELVAV